MSCRLTLLTVFMAAWAVFVCAPVPVVHAQDTPDKATTQTEDKAGPDDNEKALVPVENPYMDKIRVKAVALSKNLDEAQLEILQDVRVGFGMVRSVRLVMGDVGNAVAACADNLPDISEKITARHKAWVDAVDGAVKKSEAQIEALVESDVFGKDKDTVKDYLSLTDKAAQHADDSLEKSIVTNEKTCQALLESLDNTQDKLVTLLTDIEWPSRDTDTDSEEAEKITDENEADADKAGDQESE